jgi:signal transduction histidine kinase
LPYKLPCVYADPKRTGQIIRNLLSNAVKYTPSGGSITVTAAAHLNHIEVRVSDTGNGIAAEHIPYIFERFYRVDPSRSRDTGGAGLGLAIVKQLVEAQNGQIKLHSEVGKGTTFTFTLPIYRLQHETITMEAEGIIAVAEA